MAYTVGVDPFEFKAAGFQPSTQACDCSLVDTDVNNHVDVLGHADWFDATLKSEQPHHLTANKAPASKKFYVELEQDVSRIPPGLASSLSVLPGSQDLLTTR